MNSLKLKAARVGRGLTQEDLAKTMQITSVNYCNKENGKRAFTTKEIIGLKKILGLKVDEVNEIFFDGKLTDCLNDELSAISEIT